MSESGALSKYIGARNSFSAASGTFQSIIVSTGLSKKVDIPNTLPYILTPEYLVNPDAPISGASFLSSTEQMKKGASDVIDIIDNIEKQKNLDREDLGKFLNLRTEMKQVIHLTEQSQKEEFGSVVSEDSDRSTEDIMTYYHSIADMEFCTKNLHSLARS
jgi:hypothetical protein